MSSICSEETKMTIKELIYQANSEADSERTLRREEKIRKVYEACPDLKKADKEIGDLRGKRLVAVIDRNDKLIKICDEQLDKLRQQKELILKSNKIDPGYDEEEYICSKCRDTGFVKGKDGTDKVCSCRKDLIGEAIRDSGLADYASFDMKNYRNDYLGEETARAGILSSMVSVMMNTGAAKDKDLWLYSGKVQSGKSYLAICVLKAAVKLGKSVYYIKCEDVGYSSETVTDALRSADFIVIDDFAGEVTQDNRCASALNSIIETRSAAGLKTVLVSSMPKDDLISTCDMRIAGKIRNCGDIR